MTFCRNIALTNKRYFCIQKATAESEPELKKAREDDDMCSSLNKENEMKKF